MIDGKSSWIRTPAALAIVAAVSWLGGTAASAQSPRPASAPAPVGQTQVHALATIEPESGLITIGSRPGARILEILVKPGDDVTAGQPLATLEGHDRAKAQLALAELQKARADFERTTKKDGLVLERATADKARAARLSLATQTAQILRKKLDESTPLYNTLGATLTGKDKIEADAKYLELQLQTLKAETDVTLLNLESESLAKQRELEDRRLDDANPEFQLADRQIDAAKAAVDETVVTAPRAGRVLEVLARAGEVGSGELLQMGDLSAMSAIAEVFQSDALRLRVGDPATVELPGATVKGKVTRVGVVIGRNQAASLDPRALRDLRVARVTIALEEPEPAARLINLEAQVTIIPGGGE